MKRLALLLAALTAGLRPGFASAAEPGAAVSFVDTAFAEKWAFAPDRAALLDELPPLSDAKFYFATLLLQQQGKTDEARASLDAWRDAWLRRNGINNAEPAMEEYRRLKRRQAALECQQRKAAACVDADDPGCLIVHDRFGIAGDLAVAQRRHASQGPVQPMRRAAVAFAGDDRGGEG
jgi:hypothetical protein